MSLHFVELVQLVCISWMQTAKLYNRKIVHYVADDAKKRVNAAFLIGAYSVCLMLCLLIRQ